MFLFTPHTVVICFSLLLTQLPYSTYSMFLCTPYSCRISFFSSHTFAICFPLLLIQLPHFYLNSSPHTVALCFSVLQTVAFFPLLSLHNYCTISFPVLLTLLPYLPHYSSHSCHMFLFTPHSCLMFLFTVAIFASLLLSASTI
jgi:hypothetical protein